MNIASDHHMLFKIHLERRKRQRIAMSVVPIALGMLALFGLQYFPYLGSVGFRVFGLFLAAYPTLIIVALFAIIPVVDTYYTGICKQVLRAIMKKFIMIMKLKQATIKFERTLSSVMS